jgi:hypothetical protein
LINIKVIESIDGIQSHRTFGGWTMLGGLTRLLLVSGAFVLSIVFASVGATYVFAGDSLTSKNYVPRLGDFMNTMQMRHIKLWFSGRAANWPLAEYELEQMLENFQDIAFLYSGISVADMVSLMQPANEIKSAIAAKNVSDFSKAFGNMTAACNGCHREIGRAYIVIQVPTASPFSNQVFPSK